jgi:amino acid transporter
MIRGVSETLAGAVRRVERLVLGRTKSPTEAGIFRHISLIAFFAWIGLGADGLTSSCYGPEEAYLALRGHTHLAVFLALATALTVAVIATSYSQIIQRFPSGGGGYIVATHLLSPGLGVVSGSALVIDYVLTIAVSVASGVDALLSFASHADSPLKIPLCLAVILVLVALNLRGVKESVTVLMPIFVVFVITHAVLIVGSLARHADALPGLWTGSIEGTRDSIQQIGLWATLFIFLRAFSMGAGTYTGIEAVSNGLPVLREPRVRTGQRTMLYMAISLALTAGGILIGYRLFGVEHQPGRTLNASLLHHFADGWNTNAVPWGALFVGLTLLAEGSLLFVAAQTGFVDGPRVMASMAVDRWLPNRFANLSSRLVTGNGILFMAVAAAAVLLYSRAKVSHLVVMYSINVFVTFTLSQLGMVRHWWRERREQPGWRHKLAINGAGMVISLAILVVTVALKFFQGGWLTVVITGGFVVVAFLVRRHYRRVAYAIGLLNVTAQDAVLEAEQTAQRKSTRTVALFVNRYDGMGLHALARVRTLFGRELEKVIFISVAQVDSDHFHSVERVEKLRRERVMDLDRYVSLVKSEGLQGEVHWATATDVVAELERLAVDIAEQDPDVFFVAGQLVFGHETISTRLLHNEVAFALQRRLTFRGLNVLVLPVRVPELED